MSDLSARLALPYLQPSQAQKHVTHNEALQLLDILVQLTVKAFDVVTPPAAPQAGDVYAIGDAPTGGWSGQAGKLAAFTSNAWIFITPQEGWQAQGSTEPQPRVWRAGSWEAGLSNLPSLGISADADAFNRLAVSAPATLLSHAGSNHRVKVNKATPADTASLLFQDGFSGRAEMGLAGSNDFSVKVSADGTTWRTPVLLEAGSGDVHLADGAVVIEEGAATNALRMRSNGDFRVGRWAGGVNNGNILLYPNDRWPSISYMSGSGRVGRIYYDIQLNDMTVDTGTGDLRFRANGPETMRLTADGKLGLGLTSPARQLHLKDAMRLQPGAAPANPAAGDLYFDSATSKLCCHDGSVWHDLF
ncbi:DUF2793 domain-containing protein [Sulfitobacter sp. F26169L]|uniref:DUF2793 domain-containing protein n=1 Tax=Sulfitobacter sp. F26169L TaxID=2996015 RepID=UPI0022609F01|nr:DUF2793 domain-containing protein [Sulfitobacter sp. F26169L]MCX7568046.1 DUF2793 domain-containing protein [Sulfitobacter sp. F26169L]